MPRFRAWDRGPDGRVDGWGCVWTAGGACGWLGGG